MLHIFKHISIGPVVVWLDWMPLSECDHHWMRLNALEHTPSARECLWASIECAWMHLNALWVHVNAFEWALNAVECGWVHMNAFKWVLTQLNPLNYWFLQEIECTRTPLSDCECDWMHLNVLCMCVNTFERVLNALECAWTCSEYMWMPLSKYWM